MVLFKFCDQPWGQFLTNGVGAFDNNFAGRGRRWLGILIFRRTTADKQGKQDGGAPIQPRVSTRARALPAELNDHGYLFTSSLSRCRSHIYSNMPQPAFT